MEAAVAVTNGKRKAEDDEEVAPKKTKTETGAIARGADGEQEASANVFVGKLSWNVDNDWLKSEFDQFGEISSARVMFDRTTQKSRGFGYVEFANVEDATKAVEAMNGKEIDGREINVNFASARPAPTEGARQDRAKQFNDKPSDPSKTLFVGNLSFQADENTIYETFGEYGSVQSVRLITDRETGAPKGFGYVEFEDVDQAKAALEALAGQDVAGRSIRLDYAPARDNNNAGGGGRGGFGGGRGGGRGGFGGDRGGRGGFGGGRGGDRGGRGGGRGRGAPRGGPRTGGSVPFAGKKMTFE
jgi:nucleolin